MKYVVFLGDGMADRPVPQLGGRTPLEAAAHPQMDRIASEGILGLARTVPHGMKPGSATHPGEIDDETPPTRIALLHLTSLNVL